MSEPESANPQQSQWRFFARLARLAIRHRLDELIPAEQTQSFTFRTTLKLLHRVLPSPTTPVGERLRASLLELGPVYIKLGQLLSTRRDLIPSDIADSLSKLQDQVPPIEAFDVEGYVTEQLGQDASEVFSNIDPEPLACASIAQVHAATLANSDAVVIKLVRPGIEPVIKSDMQALKALAQSITRWIPDARRLQLEQVCEDHERVLLNELNMYHEARNQVQLRLNFADSDLLYVPRVYRDYTRPKLLVMERMYAPSIAQLDTFRDAGVDMKVLAHKGVETFFLQVFEHNFFHADMHPGNILVDISDPSNPRYIALDCAIIGSLTKEDQNYLAQNLLAFFARDYKKVVDLHLDSGWIPAHTDAAEFEAVIRDVCDPIFAKPLAEISFGEFVLTLFQTAAKFDMQIQPQLVLLQKTLLYIEGLGRQLYPELDLWETAEPFMQRWASRHLGPAAVVNQILDSGPEFWDNLALLPQQVLDSQRQLSRLRQQLSEQQLTLARIDADNTRHRKRRTLQQVMGFGFIAVAVMLLWQPLESGVQTGELGVISGLVTALIGSTLIFRA